MDEGMDGGLVGCWVVGWKEGRRGWEEEKRGRVGKKGWEEEKRG